MANVRAITATARSHRSLPPGQASTLYGCLTFLDQGAFGRIARAGLNALKDRQYAAASILTEDLFTVFDLVEAILDFRPRRCVRYAPSGIRR